MNRLEWDTGAPGSVEVAEVGERFKTTREAHILVAGVTVERWRVRRGTRLQYRTEDSKWQDGLIHWARLPQWARHGVIDALGLLTGGAR